ncbi:MAG: RNA polymerase sigma factor [Phycisphaerales bacterium]|nr:RNA polymerase sigma factor [Phycisphaerales bacterium]
MDQRTDEQVLESYRRGEAAALEVLIRRHHDDLLRFLYRLTGSRTLAEDVFQETFLQIHLSAGTFDVTRRFKPWLFTIAANKARDMLRKNARRRTLDLDAPVGGGASGGGGGGSGGGEVTFIDLMEIDGLTPAEGVLDAERDAKVQQVVSELPLLMREILLLAYFQRMSYSQIAEALDIPLGTVKSRLHSAVAAFAKKWQGVNKDE